MVIDRLYPALLQLALPRTRWIIIGLHLALLGVLFAHQGILTDQEALKYVGCAEAVLQGDFRDITGNYLKYAAYVLFLVPFVAVGQLWLAVVAQILLGMVAAEALGRLTERFTQNVGLGRMAMAIFLLCPLIQTWALALYTEYFFTCMAVLFLERITRNTNVDPGIVAFASITLFARPVGMFIVVPALLWKLQDRFPIRIRPWLLRASGLLLFMAAISFPRVAAPQLEPIAGGQVIAGVGGVNTDEFSGNTIADAHRFMVRQVGLVGGLEITVRRIGSLYTLTRSYYSPAHNVMNALFYLLYPFAALGIWKAGKDPRVRLLVGVLVLNTLLVGITHDEWSGRFLVPLLPWIILLAVHALKKSPSTTP